MKAEVRSTEPGPVNVFILTSNPAPDHWEVVAMVGSWTVQTIRKTPEEATRVATKGIAEHMPEAILANFARNQCFPWPETSEKS